MKIHISDVTQVLLAHAANSLFLLNLKTGQLVEKDNLPASENMQHYLPLPMAIEAQTNEICWDYTQEIEDLEIQHELQTILNRHDETYEFPEFTETLYYHGLEEEWETYKEECLQHIIADWCDMHKIEYSE